MKSPYRHSVWFDVFGVVAMFALLLAPLAILASEIMGRGGGGGGGVVSAGGGSAAPRQPRPAISRRKARGSGPLAYSAPNPRRTRPSGAATAVPFSESWRREATPDLSVGPVGSGRVGEAPMGETGAPSAGSPIVAERRGRAGASAARHGPASRSGTNWRGQAQRFSGRVRALSNQLGQIDRESASEQRASSGAQTSASRRAGGRASADDPGLPNEPTVPIDDHLHWLIVAGVLWGAWRLHRG